MTTWIKKERKDKYDDCPRCKNDTLEVVSEDGLDLAERCPVCQWQVNFGEEIKRVPYGSPPPTPAEVDF